MDQQSHYELLGVSPGATKLEIKRAYRKLARQYHPDSAEDGGSEYLFQLITEAYAVLSDERKRDEYDNKHGYLGARTRERLNKYKEQQAAGDRASESSAGNRNGEPRDSVHFQQNLHSHAQANAGLNNLRFQGEKMSYDGPGILHSVADTIDPWFERFGDFLSRLNPFSKRSSKAIPKNATVESALQGERYYHFVIDALESIRGTRREIALNSPNGPQKVVVNIPPGVDNGAVLRVSAPTADGTTAKNLKVKIEILPHTIVERSANDITVKIPLTIGEAINGTEIDVPTTEGSIRVKIPPAATKRKRLRLKGKGLLTGSERGDLYVLTYIVPPDRTSTVVQEAVKAIDAHYLDNMRRKIPKQL